MGGVLSVVSPLAGLVEGALKWSDDVIHDAHTIESVRPDILVKGQDYSVSDVVGRQVVERSGGRVVLLPLVAHRSTSELIARIREPIVKSSS